MNEVTIVIPNYNGKEYLEPCLNSLMRQTMKEFDVIVVDDGSADDSAEFVRRAYPGVRLIVHEKNSGFCRAVNTGVASTQTPYVILLNNDTVAGKNFVKALYDAVRSGKRIFSASACMLRYDDTEKLDGAGDLYSALGWSFARGRGESRRAYGRTEKIFSACGGAAIYRTEVFKKLGGLDEAHFAYLEDLDLGYRAQLRGYINIYAPKAKVIHAGSATFGSGHSPRKVRLSAQNNIYVIYKNMPGWQIALNAPFLLAGFLTKYAYFTRKGLRKEYSAGLHDGFRLCKTPEAKKKRKGLKKNSFANYRSVQKQLWRNMFRRKPESRKKAQ